MLMIPLPKNSLHISNFIVSHRFQTYISNCLFNILMLNKFNVCKPRFLISSPPIYSSQSLPTLQYDNSMLPVAQSKELDYSFTPVFFSLIPQTIQQILTALSSIFKAYLKITVIHVFSLLDYCSSFLTGGCFSLPPWSIVNIAAMCSY